MARKPSKKAESSTANLGFEAKLWLAADKLRNNMDASEYKHVVLGLIFLKYISDTFEEHREKLLGQLFYSTQISVYLWFLVKNKAANAKCGFRDHRVSEDVLSLAA